jgi:hypothetical protein
MRDKSRKRGREGMKLTEIKCRRGKMQYILQEDYAVIYMPFKGVDYLVEVDIETIKRIKDFGHKWCFRTIKNGIPKYIGTTIRDETGNVISLSFHRWIMNVTENIQVDHIDTNTLNNRSNNFRIAEPFENKQNMNPYKKSTTGIRGVRFVKSRGTWRATVKVKGKYVFDKTFKTKEEAAEAVIVARRIYMPFSKENRQEVVA